MARILISEDDPNIYKLIEYRMSHLGHDVQWAADGLQALSAVATSRPDLVLLDVMMPHLDGFEVLKRLKTDPATATIPVIMLTARGQERDIRQCMEQGAYGYIIKPFRFPELIAHVDAALAQTTT